MSGIEIYKQLQKSSKPLARKVIFITGDAMEKDTMDFLSTARAPYTTKPFEAEQIKEVIRNIL